MCLFKLFGLLLAREACLFELLFQSAIGLCRDGLHPFGFAIASHAPFVVGIARMGDADHGLQWIELLDGNGVVVEE